MTRHLEKMKLPLDMAEKLGIIRRKETGGYYDIFRNRLLHHFRSARPLYRFRRQGAG
jgi:DNA primase